MTITTPIRRPLGTMIVYGYPRVELAADLAIATRIGATHLEILPNWRTFPDPADLVQQAADAGLTIHSVHGCWGSTAIVNPGVDLASRDEMIRLASFMEIRECIAWSATAGASFLVVHPGGLADPGDFNVRREKLISSLKDIGQFAKRENIMVCVENMPPGVYPGTNMADLATIVAEVDSPAIALAMDTGHAFLAASRGELGDPGLAQTTLAAGRWLATTHVHDNNGRQDLHWPPGLGGIDWGAWVKHLDAIDYRGPIMLECIRHLRDNPNRIDEAFLDRLDRLTGLERS